ncbi:MAG: polysaccharide deacetylase [Eubacteriales bacterium]|nr:polysaccharide deacetylase [Eubacteriales bacterium]
MDKYSYDPNARIARRIKERERKRKRNRRIMLTVVLVVLIVCVVFGIGKLLEGRNIKLPDFNPIEGFNRLVDSIRGEETVSNDSNHIDIEIPPIENVAPVVEEEDEMVPEVEIENVVDILSDTEAKSSKGVYPLPSNNNNLLDIFKTAKGETEKICCLTFDDGPNKVTTPQILDILAEYNIKATFFELGEKLEANKGIAKRTYDEGHLLANHTYTQKYSTIYTSWDTFWNEVQRTEALITEITGEDAYKLVRMPGGSFNSGVYGGVKQDYRAKLAENNYYFIDWSVDNGDNGNRNADEILNYVKEYTGSKHVVLLMEDATARQATVKSLRSVIEYLQECGYVFKRLDEILYYSETEVHEAPVEEIIIPPYDTFTRGFNI